MKKTSLVISFGGTLRSMVRQAVTAADLNDALFYLGCTDAHAKSEADALYEMGSHTDIAQQREVYGQFRAALDDAESHGRVAWRDPLEPNTWEELNDLLIANCLPIIVPTESDGLGENRYSYPAVAQAVHDQGLPYEVIWNRRS